VAHICKFVAPSAAVVKLTEKHQEVNVLGVHTTTVAWVKSQPDPKKPTGTIITINTGLSCMTVSGTSAYTISKLAAQRYMEFVATGTYLKFHEYDYKSARKELILDQRVSHSPNVLLDTWHRRLRDE
jgi:hypothetical protein